ncbi:MAG: SDR family oxidoreductase [Isosphaeraceae bacterium]
MRIVVTGSTGQLGHYLVDTLLKEQGHLVFPWGRKPAPDRWGIPARPVELTETGSIERALLEADPELIVHAAAVSSADSVHRDPEGSWAVNVGATRSLVRWCRERGRRLLFTSTDMVFDGERGWYREQDEPAPVLAYGRTKVEAEAAVAELDDGLVARISLLFGPSISSVPAYYDRAMAALRSGQSLAFFEDEFRTPLDYATAAAALVRLARSRIRGVVHLGGRERLSRFELMRRAAVAEGVDPSLVTANRRSDASFAEPRPRDLSLDTSRLEQLLPGLDRPGIEEAIRAQA